MTLAQQSGMTGTGLRRARPAATLNIEIKAVLARWLFLFRLRW